MREWGTLKSDVEKIRTEGYDKTFFETDYHSIPAMDIILGAMRYLWGVPNRRERFEKAVEMVYESILEWR